MKPKRLYLFRPCRAYWPWSWMIRQSGVRHRVAEWNGDHADRRVEHGSVGWARRFETSVGERWSCPKENKKHDQDRSRWGAGPDCPGGSSNAARRVGGEVSQRGFWHNRRSYELLSFDRGPRQEEYFDQGVSRISGAFARIWSGPVVI